MSAKPVSTESQDTLKTTASAEISPPEKQSSDTATGEKDSSSKSNTETEKNSPLRFASPLQDAPLNFKPAATSSAVPVYGGMGSGNSDAPLSFSGGGQQQYGYYQQQQQQAGGSGYDYSSYHYGAYNQPYTEENEEQEAQVQAIQQQQVQQDSYLQDKEVSLPPQIKTQYLHI